MMLGMELFFATLLFASVSAKFWREAGKGDIPDGPVLFLLIMGGLSMGSALVLLVFAFISYL
jgi:hypothetical protein